MRPRNLPGIAVAQPVVGILLLPAIDDGLLKHAVFIAKTVAGCGKLHGGHRVEEARRKAAQTAVAQAGIGFLLEQIEPVDAFFSNYKLRHGIEQEVRNIVGQRAADEKLHGEVVNALGIVLFVGCFCLNPALGEDVADGMRESFEAFPGAGYLRVDRPIKNQMAFVEGAVGPGKRNRATAILLEKVWNFGCTCGHGNDFCRICPRDTFCTHWMILSLLPTLNYYEIVSVKPQQREFVRRGPTYAATW